MSTPTVIETRIELEPVTFDPFVADLDRPALDTPVRLADLRQSAAVAGRRIYD